MFIERKASDQITIFQRHGCQAAAMPLKNGDRTADVSFNKHATYEVLWPGPIFYFSGQNNRRCAADRLAARG
jgi:hypothetical protein